MASSSAIIYLLQQLFKRNYRQDKSFDKYQLHFLKKLQSSASNESDIELYNECYELLKAIPNQLEEELSEGRLIVSQSQLQLERLALLSDHLKDKISSMQRETKPYTIKEHHTELVTLIKIYQRAIIEVNKNTATTKENNKTDIKLIRTELQQVMLGLNVGEAYTSKLEQIRLSISNETDPLTLPHYCLKIITLITESAREERRSSRHFLYLLNDSLTQFYLNFSQTSKMANDQFKQQDTVFKTIQEQADKLKEHCDTIQDVAILREYAYQCANNVQQIIKDTEQQQKQKFRHKFQSMVRQIKALQNETQRYQKTLKQQGKELHIDFLTKIPNRSAWSERLEIEKSRFNRYQTPLVMAVIDIDEFKHINDTYGHLSGDKVLSVIAQTLQKSIRSTDFIARFGGEEFTLLLPEISRQDALQILNKLCARIEAIPFKFKQETITVTISIGFTEFYSDDQDDEAFTRADTALYEAKSEGKNRVNFNGKSG
jgi:diguanylate cyclase (GGDEF)-like protein